MDKIEHKTVSTNGINLHVASIGSGPEILFLHGFPQLWYSWRHQLLALSSLGYRAIAPDLRGFGDSDSPPSLTSYTSLHIVGDLVGLLDALGLEKVFLVAHDWGAIIGWHFCLLRPDRIKAYFCLSVPFLPRNPKFKPIDGYRAAFGDDFYVCRFQKPGEAEEDFAQCDTRGLIKKFFSTRDPRPFCLPKEGFKGIPEISELPSWISEDDITYYANKFDQKGFTGGLNYYRAVDLTWELMAPWTGVKIEVPVKFVIGDLDLVYNFPGNKDYIHGGGFKKDVPLLQDASIMEGVGHFINEEKAEEVSSSIYEFFKQF